MGFYYFCSLIMVIYGFVTKDYAIVFFFGNSLLVKGLSNNYDLTSYRKKCEGAKKWLNYSIRSNVNGVDKIAISNAFKKMTEYTDYFLVLEKKSKSYSVLSQILKCFFIGYLFNPYRKKEKAVIKLIEENDTKLNKARYKLINSRHDRFDDIRDALIDIQGGKSHIDVYKGLFIFDCDIMPIQLSDSESIYFFPGFVIGVSHRSTSIVFSRYDDLKISYKESEERSLSYESYEKVVRIEWLHQRKNGERDKRYSNNKRFIITVLMNLTFNLNGVSFTFRFKDYNSIQNLKYVLNNKDTIDNYITTTQVSAKTHTEQYNGYSHVAIDSKESAVNKTEKIPVNESLHTSYDRIRSDSRKKSFYEFGKKYSSYEDKNDLESYEPFHQYYSSYCHMSAKQLESYFVWRTKYRKSIMDTIDTSYLFVFSYELLFGIGSNTTKEKFDNIVLFLDYVITEDSKVYNYLSGWLFDYCIVNELPKKFINIAISKLPDHNNIKKSIKTNQIKRNLLNAQFDDFIKFLKIESKYNIDKGSFSRSPYHSLTDDIIVNVLKNLDMSTLMQLVFIERSNNWSPFSGTGHDYSLKSIKYKNENFEVSYTKYSGQIKYLDYDKDAITYLLRIIESSMDNVFVVTQRIKNKQYARIDGKIKMQILNTVESYKTQHEKEINELSNVKKKKTKSNAEEQMEINQKPIVIDVSKLKGIRTKSDITAEKLITEELYKEYDVEEVVEDVIVVEEVDVDDEWSVLINSLNTHQKEIVSKLIFDSNNLSDYMKKHHLMIEEVVAAINEKSLDAIGDNLIAFDSDEISIYEDYLDEVKTLLA